MSATTSSARTVEKPGSAFVQRLQSAPSLEAGLAAVRELAADLAAGARAAAPARS